MECLRFLPGKAERCIYCSHTVFKELEFEPSLLNPNYKIYAHEITVDGQAYTIIHSLGRGGFSRVIKVFNPGEKKYYALKVPLIFDELFSNQKGKPEKELEKSQDYMENEIKASFEVSDEAFLYRYKKGMVQTNSKGRDIQFPVLIMELAECTLEELIKYEAKGGDNHIPYDEKVKIVRESINAISHLHSLGVLHRDLSPDNLFVVDRGSKIAYVLGDFGAATSLLDRMDISKSSEVIGHREYIDPCRYNKKYKHDPRLDIYSLGIIVTEILIGKLWIDVIGRENIPDFLALDFERDFLLEFGPKYIMRHIIEVLKKAVKRNIEERYASIDDFRQALFAILDIDPAKVTIGNISPKTRTIDFYFTIRLPFEVSEKTYFQETITYQEGKKIELSDYRGAKIVFNDFFPQQVQIKNTSFYWAAKHGNAVLLNFNNSQFIKIQKLIEKHKHDIKGELCFKGVMEITGS